MILSQHQLEEIAKLIQNHVGEMIAVVFSGDIGFYSGAKKLSMMLRKAVGKVCNMVDDTTGTTEQIQRFFVCSQVLYCSSAFRQFQSEGKFRL